MRKILCFILLALMAFAACAEELGELAKIENGDIQLVDEEGMPYGWYTDMWHTDGESKLDVANVDGKNCLHVVNIEENDARFVQTVTVQPETIYRFSCGARAEGVEEFEDACGANISIIDTLFYSEPIFNTNGKFETLEIYVETAEEQTEIDLAARVGGYSALCKGEAWFTDFTVSEVEEVPDGAIVYGMSTYSDIDTAQTTQTKNATSDNAPLWMLVACGMALIFTGIIRKTGRLSGSVKKPALWLLGIIAVGIIVRVFVGIKVYGYAGDLGCFAYWADSMFKYGIRGFYGNVGFCDYPPLYMALLYIVGAIRSLCGMAYLGTAHVVLIKSLPMAFDIFTAIFVYSFAKKRAGEKLALALCAIIAINPAIITDSAAWGQIDSVFTFVVAVCAAMLVEGRFEIALPLFAVAGLAKPQALLFAPLGIIALIIALIRAENKHKVIVRAVIGLALAAVVFFLVAFIFHPTGTNAVEWLWGQLLGTAGSYPFLSIGAFNLYTIFSSAWVSLDSVPVVKIIAWALFGLSYVYSGFLYIRARRKNAIFLCAAVLIMLIYAFGPMMHERYVYPAILLLVMAYAIERDRRLLISLSCLTITLFINQAVLLQFALEQGTYGYLTDVHRWVNVFFSVIVVLNAVFTALSAYDIIIFDRIKALKPIKKKRVLIGNGSYKLKLTGFDAVCMMVVTLVYSVLAFTNLGDMKAAQTYWDVKNEGEYAVFDLGEQKTFRMMYYGNICDVDFDVEFSDDGITWNDKTAAGYEQGEMFKWLSLDNERYYTARYVKLTAQAGLKLNEIGFRDKGDGLLMTTLIEQNEGGNAECLTDERDCVPVEKSYMNSMYFDEIYHARTAYENLHGLPTYEWTHPPLGKVLIMIGIKIFGMCPFGWRFMGALTGVIMLPVMYLIVKQLGLKSRFAMFAMILLAADSMHFTQTRIATIDSFAVLFIMIMYLFMIRYVKMSFYRQPLRKTFVPLALCGVTMAVAWAIKWICIYASIGIAILFFWSFFSRLREYVLAKREGDILPFWKNGLITGAVCVVCFLALPALVYVLSYHWQLAPEGGIKISRVLQLQESMMAYHTSDTVINFEHPYIAHWYQWPTIARPIWYYYDGGTTVSGILCLGNIVVWWGGLLAIVFVMFNIAIKRLAEHNYTIVAVGFLSEFLPWVWIERSTFIYHYFASVPFIIIAGALTLYTMEKALVGDSVVNLQRRHAKNALRASFFIMLGICLLAVAIFALFYPLESGVPTAVGYVNRLRWFDW